MNAKKRVLLGQVIKKTAFCLFVAVLIGSIAFTFPTLLTLTVEHDQNQTLSEVFEQFPVTVDPRNKSIVESVHVNAFFEETYSPSQAAIGNVHAVAKSVFEWMALSIAATPWYQNLAAVATVDNRLVAIAPGMRKEQVVKAFGNALMWSDAERKEFLTAKDNPLLEGSFLPGIYPVSTDVSPRAAQTLLHDRFTQKVLSRYGTTTAEIVPLTQALIIASLIEREAGGPEDARFISGIIWNRLFINMNLQIDATLQYAKANKRSTANWWPKVVPADRFIESPYNTYLHRGLPPTPIANPSVASILAALNPRETSCLFYFHDAAQKFHCTETYAEHVALLKKHYGRGK
ncbi:endolytic transglycosylase MltG [Candidatus Kaiserbacteria bacterium]|nr:endolytic transglycosylase MltG [Candidatus Kaiserbacteria bacterium]